MKRVDASFGVVLPTYAGDATSSPGAEEYWGLYDLTLNDDVTWSRVAQAAKDSERLGYTSLWVPDHFMLGKNGMTFEAWTTLSAVSQITTKSELGTWVSCNNYRNPALAAKMATSLSLMSGGRFVLGYGAGWYAHEYEAYGYAFPKPSERAEMLEEGVKIIRGMMEHNKFSFTGRYYRVKEVVNNPKPTRPTQLMIGGWSKKIVALAARYADQWDIGAEPTYAEYGAKVEFLKEQLRLNGRNFDEFRRSIGIHVLIAENESELLEKKRRVMRVIEALGQKIVQLPSLDYKFDMEKVVVGTPDQVRERLAKYVELGCQRFELMFMDYPKYSSLELFASTVMS